MRGLKKANLRHTRNCPQQTIVKSRKWRKAHMKSRCAPPRLVSAIIYLNSQTSIIASTLTLVAGAHRIPLKFPYCRESRQRKQKLFQRPKVFSFLSHETFTIFPPFLSLFPPSFCNFFANSIDYNYRASERVMIIICLSARCWLLLIKLGQ